MDITIKILGKELLAIKSYKPLNAPGTVYNYCNIKEQFDPIPVTPATPAEMKEVIKRVSQKSEVDPSTVELVIKTYEEIIGPS
jgi:hypothetical protein